MKKAFILGLLLISNKLYGLEDIMVRDSFILDGNIKVDITIEVTESIIDIEVKIKNESGSRIMLNNYYFRRNRYFYFANENEIKGKVISLKQIEYNWGITSRAIDIIEHGEEKIYSTKRGCKRESYAFGEHNAFIIYDDEGFIVFGNPASVKIVIQYVGVHSAERMAMDKIVGDAIHVPKFSRSYVIKEFN